MTGFLYQVVDGGCDVLLLPVCPVSAHHIEWIQSFYYKSNVFCLKTHETLLQCVVSLSNTQPQALCTRVGIDDNFEKCISGFDVWVNCLH